MAPYRTRAPTWDGVCEEAFERASVCSGEEARLRPYQREAVATVVVAPDRFVSGEIEMGCGLGKTYVGGEIVRLSRAPAVIVTQHQISVGQWIDHLRDVVGLRRVITTTEPWDFRAPLPDALVTTYSTLVRVAADLTEHRALLETGAASRDVSTHKLLWALHCLPFGVLLLDEVHIGVADQFRSATQLNARVVVGLSGSMVREDDRLNRMAELVGPRLYRYHAMRTMRYDVLRVPLLLPPEAATARPRSSFAQALHALNPAKICALEELLWEHRDEKVIIFCDSRIASEVLQTHLARSLLLHGGVAEERRAAVLEAFCCDGGGRVLITTRVCDAAIDFPSGCAIVNLYNASGSRQQEVQRAGRGSRDGSATGSHVLHIVNVGTGEERFVRHRLEHMATLCELQTTYTDVDASAVTDHHHAPIRRLLAWQNEQAARGTSRKRPVAHML